MRLLALLVALHLVASALPARAGAVEGTVTIQSPLRKKAVGHKTRALRYRDPAQAYPERSKTSAEARDEVRHVVVHLVGPVAGGPAHGPAMVVQKNREFSPHVLAVRVGATVQFPNQDVVYHGLYSDSAAAKFELPEYPKGESRSVKMEKPGVVELFCGIHPHMSAHILVLETDFFTQPGPDHRYRLEGVPPGRYVVRAWHPRLKPVSKTVEVKKDGTVRLDFTL